MIPDMYCGCGLSCSYIMDTCLRTFVEGVAILYGWLRGVATLYGCVVVQV